MKTKIGNLLTAVGFIGAVTVLIIFFGGYEGSIIELTVFVVSALLLLIGICLRNAGRSK